MVIESAVIFIGFISYLIVFLIGCFLSLIFIGCIKRRLKKTVDISK